MTDIDVEMARILDVSRHAHDPSPRDARRVHGALAAALAGMGASAVTGTSAAATTTITGSAGLVKIAAIGLLIGSATGGAGFVVAAVVSPPRVAHTHTSTVNAPKPGDLGFHGAVTTRAPAGMTERDVAVTEIREQRVTARADGARANEIARTVEVAQANNGASRTDVTATVQTKTEMVPPRTALAEEVAALRRAQEHLDRAPSRALRDLDAMAAAYPHGALNEEALAARVLANCKAGNLDVAAQTATRFFAQYPNSVHAARVRASCAGKSVSAPDGTVPIRTMNESETQHGGSR